MMQSWFRAASVLAIGCSLWISASDAGNDKAGLWKALLSDDVYQQLAERSIQAIESTAKSGDKNALLRIHIEGVILAGYTLSLPDAKNAPASKLRGAALQATLKKDIEHLKSFGKMGKEAAPSPADGKLLKARLPAIEDLMEIFRNKKKGGEGLHADLQYQPKIKNLNGIEALIGALATKKLNDTNLDKVAKELPLLASRIAVVAVLTHESAPQKNAGQWHGLSIKMRDSAIELAKAAQKKNADGILQAAVSLEATCTQCHSAFKAK